MKIRMLWAVAGMLTGMALPGLAQEKPPTELPPVETRAVAPVEPCQLCCPECEKPGIKILWLECQVPLQRLVPREVITEKKVTTLEVHYREEKRIVTDIVLKPREVIKEVPCTTMKAVQEVDPATGQCCTVMKPCTEIKLVKETCFVAVPEQREVVVKVPFVKSVEKVVPCKNILLEYRTEMRKEGCAIQACDVVPGTRYFVAPKPCCPE